MTRITRDEYKQLASLPQGTRVQAGSTILELDREWSPRVAFYDLTHGGYVYPHHMHDEYQVDYVTVLPDTATLIADQRYCDADPHLVPGTIGSDHTT